MADPVEGQDVAEQSDAEFFNEALAEKSEGAQPRDETGRFAPKAAEPVVEAPVAEAVVPPVDGQPPTSEKDETPVPSWRLREVSEERRAAQESARAAEQRARDIEQRFQSLQHQFQQNQPKPERRPPPDIIADPQGFIEWQQAQFQEMLEADRQERTRLDLERNLRSTHRKLAADGKGAEFEAAWQAANASDDPVLKARIRNSYDPGEELMEWHRERTAVKEIGGDLSSFLAKKQAEWAKDPKVRETILAEMRAEAGGPGKPNGASRPNVVGLPSLSRVPAASREVNMEQDDGEFFNSLPRGNRRGA